MGNPKRPHMTWKIVNNKEIQNDQTSGSWENVQ
jgi:hypothetical protein